MGDIIDVIVDAGYFRTLFKAIQEAGLVETLKEDGPFTVFAPTDEAFSKLSQSTVDDLFSSKPKLKAVLNYHIVPRKLMIDDLRKLENVKTLQGQLADVDPHRWHLHMSPKINGVSMVRRDIVTDNGVIHVLDEVLMPNLRLTCAVCGMGFTNQSDMNTHTRTVHPPEPKVATAPVPVAAPISAAAATATTSAARRTRQPAFEVHMDKSHEYRFHLKATNGEIIGESQSFPTIELCNNDIDLVKKNAPIAKIICTVPTTEHATEEIQTTENVQGPVFEEFTDVAGKWRFNLKEPNGLIILASQAYKTIDSCNNGIQSVKTNAPIAKTIYPKQKTKPTKEEMLAH